MRDLGAVAPDLGTGRLVVRPRVGRVAVLVEERDVVHLLDQTLRHPHRAVGALGARRQNDLGAVDLEQLPPLDGDVLRHDDLQPVTLEPADQREPDPRVARRRLEDRASGREGAVGLGRLDHELGDAVLDRAAGVLSLELDQDADARVGTELADLDQGRVADEVEDGADCGHDYPPATAGRMEMTSSPDTFVSSFSRYRTSSSLR